jgi:hypothetical protein
VNEIHISKRHTHSVGWRQAPLRVDPRDPDIVKVHQLDRSSGSQDAGRRDSGQLPA